MNELMDLYREAFLFGLLAGVPFTIVLQQAWAEAKRWRRILRAERERAMRCQKDWACLDREGHPEPCNNLKDVE